MVDKTTTVTNSKFWSPKTGFMSEGLTTETNIDSDEVLALREGKDPAQESLENQGLIAFIKERFERSKNKRLQDEQRWLQAYRNYRGIYGPEVAFTDSEKSRAFIKITKTKVLAAYAQVVDILYSGSKFPIGVEASNDPEGIAEAVHIDPKEPDQQQGQQPAATQSTITRPDIAKALGPLQEKLAPVQDKLKDGPGLTPTSFTWSPAVEAARKMEKKMQDQLAEANADKSLRAVAFETCLFGEGIFKGPLAKDKEYPKWSEDGEYQPVIKQIADMEFVSIWDAYPDPDAVNMTECEYFLQRHRMSKSQLRELKKRPYFREKSIELAIQDGFNYTEEYWENTIKDYMLRQGTERYEVLEYWGTVDKDFEEITDLEIPKQYKNQSQVQVNIWVCNGHILRVVFNPFTPARIPYHAVPYELNPYSFFGIGVAENMEDTQLLMNGFMRMAVDNGVLSGNVILEVNESQLVPGQDFKLTPGKIFRTQGQIGQAIHSIDIKSVTQELSMLFDKARQLADEATGIPSYSHGQGGIQGIGRTASGMQMLMGAAAQNIKAVVRNFDDYLLVPLARDLFAFNMQFEFDKEFIGDLHVVARGTTSLMRNEVRSQKVLQFLQLTNNPIDNPWVKRDYLLRELAESLDLEAEKSVNDPREAGIQAEVMKQMMIAQGIDPNQAGAQGGSQAGGMTPPTGSATGQGGSPVPAEQGFSGGGGGSANAANANKQAAGKTQ
jgi:hypothetical protein